MTRACPRSPAAREPARRAGTVLVFFALFMFVAMGIAALVIDLGFARLTQRQMQSASDVVALEALRDRDLARDPQTAASPELRDLRRRLRANRFATWQYVPELITGQEGEPDQRDGPGVFFDLGAGFGGGIDAGALIERAGYSGPRLRPNYATDGGAPVPINAAFGDVVSGDYVGDQDLDGDGLEDGAIGVDGNPFHVEDDKYARVDFAPYPAAQAPGGDAVAVRLRRTLHDFDVPAQTQGNDNLPDVSSAGTTLEWMFGRGTTMAAAPAAGDGPSPREAGIKIRATSIASSRPVVRVNPPLGNYDMGAFVDGFGVGVTPFAIHEQLWHFSAFGMWTDEGNGNLSTPLRFENGQLVSARFDSIEAGLLRPATTTRVGDRLQLLDGAAVLWGDEKNWEVQEGYAPVYERSAWNPDTSWRRRVIGFVRVRTELTTVIDPETDLPVRAMKLWKLANERTPGRPWLAPRNASALFDGLQVSREELAIETNQDGTPWNWRHLVNSLHSLERAIHAPVIVR